MPTEKQVDTIRIGAYYYNGDYRAFHTTANSNVTYPVSLPVWEASYDTELEFVDESVTQSLTGKERADPSGYRASVNLFLDNSYPPDSETIRALLERFANQFDRVVLRTTTGTKTATTVVLSNGVSGSGNTNYYNNLILVDVNAPTNQAKVTAYNPSTRVATATPTSGNTNIATWSSDISVVAKPNIPTVLGVSTDNSNVNIIYCNLVNAKFGFDRELTVNSQTIQLSGREIDRTPLISDKYRIGT
jgi:hypothetical protein